MYEMIAPAVVALASTRQATAASTEAAYAVSSTASKPSASTETSASTKSSAAKAALPTIGTLTRLIID